MLTQETRYHISALRKVEESPVKIMAIGANYKGALLTLVDRKTRITFIYSLPNKQAEILADAKINSLRGLATKSITYDNKKEFSAHEPIAETLGMEDKFNNRPRNIIGYLAPMSYYPELHTHFVYSLNPSIHNSRNPKRKK